MKNLKVKKITKRVADLIADYMAAGIAVNVIVVGQ